MRIGLTPAKSLTLGGLEIPDKFLADFVRGVVDGDGSIQLYKDRSNAWESEKYVYERLYVTVASSSRPFLEWLHQAIQSQIPIRGAIVRRVHIGRNPHWSLKLAKHDSIRLLNWMYYAPGLPCLRRKQERAIKFLSSS
jgi:hypothetical protein